MPRQIKPLNAQQIAALKPKESSYFKAVDNDGLYVRVLKTSKSWVFRDTHKSWVTIGNTASMPLATARAEVARRKAIPEEPKFKPMPYFKDFQDSYVDEIKKTLKADRFGITKNGNQWTSTIQTYCMNTDPEKGWNIGNKRIDEITPTDIKEIMVRVLPRVDTAGKLRGRLERIIDAAYIQHRMGMPYSNPATSKVVNQLVPKLAKENKVKKSKVKHHLAVPVEDAPKLFQECWAKRKSSVSFSALCFVILTCGRAGNGVEAKWSEIDQEKWVWMPESMKVDNNPTHIVPLSKMAIELLELRKVLSDDDSEWVFASTQQRAKGEPISTDSMRLLLQRMAGIAYTTHGWRSTYKNWSMEDGADEIDSDSISELALAHKVSRSGDITAPKESRLQKATLGKKIGSDTYLAYMRSGLFKRRAKQAQEWEDFLFTK